MIRVDEHLSMYLLAICISILKFLIGLFDSNESACHIRWPKYWNFNFSISPSNEYLGLISFRIDWFDLLAVQGRSGVFSSTTVRNHQFFSSQPSLWSTSHNCTLCTTGKTIALTIWTFVGKVRSLLFNMLSRFVMTFLPRSKRLLISWLQSPSAVIFGPYMHGFISELSVLVCWSMCLFVWQILILLAL